MQLRTYNLFILFLGFVSLLLGGCSSASVSLTSKLTIGMLGVFTAPTGVGGNNVPRSEGFKLIAAAINTSDGQTFAAYDGATTAFTIINRPQIIVEYDLTKVVNLTISSVSVQFDSAITASGKYNAAMSATLANATATYAIPLYITTGKAVRLNVGVHWKNTVTRDDGGKTETLEAPVLEVTSGDSGS